MEVALYIYTKKTIDESIDLILNKFKSRVIADGGTFEADNCLKNNIIALGGVYGVGLNTISDFAKRVQTDGGTFEAENCLLNIINSLGGVAPAATEVDYVRRIELFNDEKISITSSIQNVNDISKVFTDYSQSFTIPASDNNNEIFRHWYDNDLDNGFDQRQRYAGYIEIDTQVFRIGKWQLESATIKNNRVEDYKITFYGVLKSLTDKFGEDKLKDIAELNDYTIDYSGDTVKDTISTTSDSNILFPLISSKNVWQYGSGGAVTTNWDISNSATPINYTDLAPALKVARVFDAIASKYNINFNGNFLTQSRFTKAYLWLKNKEAFSPLGEKKLIEFTSISNGDGALTVNSDNYDLAIAEYNNPGSSALFYNGGDISLTLSTSTNWQVTIFKDGVQLYIQSGTGTNVYVGLGDISGNFKLYLSAAQSCTYTGSISASSTEYDYQNNSQNTYTSSADVIGDSVTSNLDLPSFMPDIKVTDFFSGILKMFNLTAFSYDETTYTLEQLENWYYQGKIKDYSENCVTDFEYERIKPYKKVNFNYEKSESLLNKSYSDANQKEYGDLSYPFNNDGADYSVKLPFENIIFNKFTGTDLQVGYAIKTDLTPYVPKPIILYQYENADCDFYFNDGAATNNITNYNVMGQDVYYQTQIHTLNFGTEFSSYTLNTVSNTLFKDYYFDYLNNLYNLKSRMVKVTMRLPYSELLSLRLNDRIVIRDKRYIINSFTTDLDTFESKFELIQDFRIITFNNSFIFEIDNIGRFFRVNTVSSEPLTWTILNDPDGAIKEITNRLDYVELDINENISGKELIYSVQSNNNDIIVIKQNA
jgi:hypothetical protein